MRADKFKFTVVFSVFSLVYIFSLFCFPNRAFSKNDDKTEFKTIINSVTAKEKLLGTHRFSVQWISWDYFGKAVVTEKEGVLHIFGEQKSRENDDFIKMDGSILEVNEKNFVFDGLITTKIYHLNAGKPYERKGKMTFRISQGRRYWRLKEMENPAGGGVVDYVDIFFDRGK